MALRVFIPHPGAVRVKIGTPVLPSRTRTGREAGGSGVNAARRGRFDPALPLCSGGRMLIRADGRGVVGCAVVGAEPDPSDLEALAVPLIEAQ